MALSRINNPFLSSSGAGNASITSPAANTLAFTTSTTERMRLDSSGNVGIGTSSPTGKLHVSAPINTKYGTFDAVTSTEAYTVYQVGGAAYGQFGDASGLVSGGTAGNLAVRFSGAMLFSGGADERMRINSGAPILCLAGGSTTATGTGIAFPATQSASANANTLDDYEEGTWTPSVGGNATYGTRIAHYTKIGDTVRVFFDISIGTIGTGSLTTLSGFPFTCSNNDSGCISYFSGLGATVYFIQIQMSGTNCIFVGLTAAGATINNGMNVFTTSARIIGTVVYKTTT